jgi:hypothetical protein
MATNTKFEDFADPANGWHFDPETASDLERR